MSARNGTIAGLGKTRVESLSDGIFSAVMTVLGLSLTLPYILGPANQPLPDLTEVVTGVLIYALSFFMIGVFWVGHHIAFNYVRRTDRTLIWINNVFLLFIGLLPLSTSLLGRHVFERVTLVGYGLNLLAVQFMLYASFRYATLHHHLVDAELDPTIIQSGGRRILLGPCLSVAAILLSFVNPLAGLATYVIYPVVYILPGRIDAFWRRQEVD
jgi:uncharacterized membrane protein